MFGTFGLTTTVSSSQKANGSMSKRCRDGLTSIVRRAAGRRGRVHDGDTPNINASSVAILSRSLNNGPVDMLAPYSAIACTHSGGYEHLSHVLPSHLPSLPPPSLQGTLSQDTPQDTDRQSRNMNSPNPMRAYPQLRADEEDDIEEEVQKPQNQVAQGNYYFNPNQTNSDFHSKESFNTFPSQPSAGIFSLGGGTAYGPSVPQLLHNQSILEETIHQLSQNTKKLLVQHELMSKMLVELCEDHNAMQQMLMLVLASKKDTSQGKLVLPPAIMKKIRTLKESGYFDEWVSDMSRKFSGLHPGLPLTLNGMATLTDEATSLTGPALDKDSLTRSNLNLRYGNSPTGLSYFEPPTTRARSLRVKNEKDLLIRQLRGNSTLISAGRKASNNSSNKKLDPQELFSNFVDTQSHTRRRRNQQSQAQRSPNPFDRSNSHSSFEQGGQGMNEYQFGGNFQDGSQLNAPWSNRMYSFSSSIKSASSPRVDPNYSPLPYLNTTTPPSTPLVDHESTLLDLTLTPKIDNDDNSMIQDRPYNSSWPIVSTPLGSIRSQAVTPRTPNSQDLSQLGSKDQFKLERSMLISQNSSKDPLRMNNFTDFPPIGKLRRKKDSQFSNVSSVYNDVSMDMMKLEPEQNSNGWE